MLLCLPATYSQPEIEFMRESEWERESERERERVDRSWVHSNVKIRFVIKTTLILIWKKKKKYLKITTKKNVIIFSLLLLLMCINSFHHMHIFWFVLKYGHRARVHGVHTIFTCHNEHHHTPQHWERNYEISLLNYTYIYYKLVEKRQLHNERESPLKYTYVYVRCVVSLCFVFYPSQKYIYITL